MTTMQTGVVVTVGRSPRVVTVVNPSNERGVLVDPMGQDHPVSGLDYYCAVV